MQHISSRASERLANGERLARLVRRDQQPPLAEALRQSPRGQGQGVAHFAAVILHGGIAGVGVEKEALAVEPADARAERAPVGPLILSGPDCDFAPAPGFRRSWFA